MQSGRTKDTPVTRRIGTLASDREPFFNYDPYKGLRFGLAGYNNTCFDKSNLTLTSSLPVNFKHFFPGTNTNY
jgi:hypothetical protein